MQQPAPTQPSPNFSSFAGLLATIASPPPDTAEDSPLWSSSDLGEDVATLSYERALRAHARYRPTNRGDGLPMPSDDLGIGASADAAIKTDAAGAIDAAGAAVAADAAPALRSAVAPDRDLRSASVTVRISKAECARLHQRAAEAGLTLSAYLRSCALEAETLRAQVKQALAEMKAGTEGPSHPCGKTAPPLRDPGRDQGTKKPGWRNLFGWIGWLTKRRR
jgi:hypothetical protein